MRNCERTIQLAKNKKKICLFIAKHVDFTCSIPATISTQSFDSFFGKLDIRSIFFFTCKIKKKKVND